MIWKIPGDECSERKANLYKKVQKVHMTRERTTRLTYVDRRRVFSSGRARFVKRKFALNERSNACGYTSPVSRDIGYLSVLREIDVKDITASSSLVGRSVENRRRARKRRTINGEWLGSLSFEESDR